MVLPSCIFCCILQQIAPCYQYNKICSKRKAKNHFSGSFYAFL
ncbi:hypothetical protein FAEPRAM212_00612 [Faecalibacterium prausnitzii M21/2]|uniref:Uncharacterized protein n=1 Tax=Faecalibacterium prausnitzii M21/2 TaxID=411485 RepID=A8S814_9FIRM|nr:hypothetical protein FAEPRAM212_00612 [Faecalibacterium prausnitzii M21/2]